MNMINLNRMSEYRKVWNQFNHKYTVSQIGEAIELIEQTGIEPTPDEVCGYEIWQKWLDIKRPQGAGGND